MLILAIAAYCSSQAGMAASQPERNVQPAQIVKLDPIRRLVRALFPELRELQDLRMVVRTEAQRADAPLVGYHLLTTIDSAKSIAQFADIAHTPLLALRVSRDETGSVTQLTVLRSSLVPVERFYKLRQLAQTHRDWSDEQFGSLMRQEGTQFGSHQQSAVEARARELLESVSAVVGPLTMSELRSPLDRVDNFADMSMLWQIVAQRRGDTRTYNVSIEPFTGRVLIFSIEEK